MYGAIVVVTTIFGPVAARPLNRVVELYFALLPLCLFPIGVTIGHAGLIGLRNVVTLLVAATAAYGLMQLLGGPAAIDAAWAHGAQEYSLQARKTLWYLQGLSSAFYGYSIWPSPGACGLFLMFAFAASMGNVALGTLSRSKMTWIGIAVIVGLFATLSRSPMLGFLLMIATYFLVPLQPAVILATVAVGFPVTLAVATALIDNFGSTLLQTSNPITERLLTVGTLGDRIHAGDILSMLSHQWVGEGYGGMGMADDVGTWAAIYNSHNFVVDIILRVGIVGFFVLIFFYIQWLREICAAFNTLERPAANVFRWSVAFSIGSIATGFVSGAEFMSPQFFLLVGISAGMARQVVGVKNQEKTTVARKAILALGPQKRVMRKAA